MLIITGSGRCGTSFMAKMAKGLGMNMGIDWNDEIDAGLERPGISRLNEAISERLKLVDHSIVVREFAQQIRAVTWPCIKDPRFISLPGVLQVWLDARQDLEFVLIYRSPMATARSAAKAFKRELAPLAIAESARVVAENFKQSVAILAASGAQFHVANFPRIIQDREHCRKAICHGPLQAVDGLLFNRIWRETAQDRLVHFKDEHIIDMLGPSMRPGHPTYSKVGEQYAQDLVDAVGKEAVVLDIGCGFGRVAEALARRNLASIYSGVDCFAPAILDCRQRFAMNPMYSFDHLNLRSARYNPDGLPIEGQFLGNHYIYDAVMGISLWTHLAPDDAQAFLREAHRVLHEDRGHLLATWFLVDDKDAESIRAGTSKCPLKTEISPGIWTSGGLLENAVGYSPELVRAWYDAAGFHDVNVQAGNWHGERTSQHFQDFIVARV